MGHPVVEHLWKFPWTAAFPQSSSTSSSLATILFLSMAHLQGRSHCGAGWLSRVRQLQTVLIPGAQRDAGGVKLGGATGLGMPIGRLWSGADLAGVTRSWCTVSLFIKCGCGRGLFLRSGHQGALQRRCRPAHGQRQATSSLPIRKALFHSQATHLAAWAHYFYSTR